MSEYDDIPLADAQIIWDRDQQGHPPVRVVGGNVPDDQRYGSSWGSCNSDFEQASPDQKVRMLFVFLHHMTIMGQMDPVEAHQALLVIPEYRAELRREGLLSADGEDRIMERAERHRGTSAT